MALFNEYQNNSVQSLIASFLIQHKNCPLPGIGTLLIKESSAAPDFLGKQINAPQQQIVFIPEENEADQLIGFIAGKKQTGKAQAAEMLNAFCNELNNSNAISVATVGSFQKHHESLILFEQEKVPVLYNQPVYAERVIHPEAEHSILVGDKETTNTAMNEYYTEETVKQDRWWIWALSLAVVAAAITVIHFSQYGFSASAAGNIIRVK